MDRYQYAFNWIHEAGRLLPAADTTVRAEEKGGHCDLVTAYDKKIECFLRNKIAEVFPSDHIVGEEFAVQNSTADTQGNKKTVWYLDPIDGTTNFVNRRCDFAISIGCISSEEPSFGLVLDVYSNRLYAAREGGGAFMNGSPIRTAGNCDISDMLFDTPSVTDIFLNPHSRQKGITRLAMDVRAVRSLGSVALELCELASGKSDICIAMRSAPWDHNAARIILKEAGGDIKDLNGTDLSYHEKSAFAAASSTEVLHMIKTKYLQPDKQ